MKRLYLLRHAKAERDADSGEDFDRPLAARGRRDAESLGRELSAKNWRPDLIVTSTSVRTLETAAHLTAAWPTLISITKDKDLYLASAARIMSCVRAAPDSAGSLMIVAHNPGLEEFALKLAGHVAGDALRRMQKKFPTCALAVFDLSIDHWARASPDFARLIAYFTPKDLADDTLA